MRQNFTRERVRELFDYAQETGIMTWRVTLRGGRNKAFVLANAGDVAGFPSGYGYWAMSVDKFRTSAHRVAWLWMTGEWPVHDIDHINGVRQDNRWSNLRLATRSENMQNMKAAHKDSSTGFLGVEKKRDRFAARICLNGKKRSLGVFATPEEAHAIYIKAKRELHERNTL